jgi:peptide/nickel transport system substrate-binding protein
MKRLQTNLRHVVLLVGSCLSLAIYPALGQSDIELAQLVQVLKNPADEIILKSGQIIEIAPLAVFPGKSPSYRDPLEYADSKKRDELRRIAAGDIKSIVFFESRFLEQLDKAMAKPDASRLLAGQSLLVDLGRWHVSRRWPSAAAANPWLELQSRIANRIEETRRRYLLMISQSARSEAEWTEALRHGDAWADANLRDALRTLWVRYGESKLKEGDYSKVRAVLNRLDERYVHSAEAEPLRAALKKQASGLIKEADDLPDVAAIHMLENALALWPQTPGLWADLEKRRQTYRVLYVAVRQLPENLSPATAWTDVEHQALELLFNRLVNVTADPALGQRYQPDLARELPNEGIEHEIQLRRDVYWSDGERLTSTDIRHTVLLAGAASAWRDLVEPPRLEGRPFTLKLTVKQGLLDPFAPLRFFVLPQKHHGQNLSRADDPAFAKAPIGTGPFRYLGRRPEGKREVAVFEANPFYVPPPGQGRGHIGQVRLVAWSDLKDDPGQPLPHLVLDFPIRSLADLKKRGYAEVHSLPNRRIYFLALNHRVPALANQDLRRALAHAIAAEQILDQHFRGADESAKLYVLLNGPFPSGSWAASPRVPRSLYQPELAKSFARKVSPVRLTLKYPSAEPGVAEACTALADQAHKLFAEVNVNVTLDLVPLSPDKMRDAIHKRDYELAYHHWDYDDDNFWLWPLFDPHASALAAGGSNFLGYENDSKLQSLLRGVLNHRQFSVVRELQRSIHDHLYERMPFIPLWQLPVNVATSPALRTGPLDAHQLFASVLDWKVSP